MIIIFLTFFWSTAPPELFFGQKWLSNTDICLT